MVCACTPICIRNCITVDTSHIVAYICHLHVAFYFHHSLNHINILTLYGYSVDGPNPCLVYELMPGGSLEDRLACHVCIRLFDFFLSAPQFATVILKCL